MAGGKVGKAIRAVCSPHIRAYFALSFLIYLGTAGYMYLALYGRIIPVLCTYKPSDPPKNCKCNDDFFICNMCQVEDIPPGYRVVPGMKDGQLMAADWPIRAQTQFITFDKLATQCLPGYDYALLSGQKPAMTCPTVNGTFTFAGCPENRCKVVPMPDDPTRLDFPTARYVITERRNNSRLCRYTAKFVKKSDCVLSCRKPTRAQLLANPSFPEYHKKRADGSFEVPVALGCPVHKGPFTTQGCEDKCEVALTDKGMATPKYDGLMANAPGFVLLDRFLKSKDVYLATPFWEVKSADFKRLVGYVNTDFLNGGLYLSDLNAIDVLYYKFTDFDRKYPAFIIKYSPVGVAVYDVSNCDTSVKGFIWQADCTVHCAPGFGDFPA
jgi:hypothetical protein